MNSKEIEEQIKPMQLVFHRHIQSIENGEHSSVPMFVPIINMLYKKYNKIPTQEEYYVTYLEKNEKNYMINKIFDLGIENGLKARIFKAYTSNVRDIHLNEKFREKGYGNTYNEDKDINSGIDFIIKINFTINNIHCYVDTLKAREFRQAKNYRHIENTKDKNINYSYRHIDFPLNPNDCYICGMFWLYKDDDILRLENEIYSSL